MPPDTIPEGLDIIESMAGTTIRRKWFTWLVLPLLLFAIVWDGFLVFWYSMAFSKADAPLIMKLFPIGHVAVGLGITYYVIASFVNKTDINLSPSFIEVVTGPFPWIGNKRVLSSEINQVLVRERRGSKGAVTWSVMYAGTDRKERKLAAGLVRREQAEFIADMIRETLRLKDRAA